MYCKSLLNFLLNYERTLLTLSVVWFWYVVLLLKFAAVLFCFQVTSYFVQGNHKLHRLSCTAVLYQECTVYCTQFHLEPCSSHCVILLMISVVVSVVINI